MADTDKLVEQLSGLSVLEIAGLVKQLEEKWGVSAAAPVAMAAGPVAAGAAAAPAAEEKTTFDVILKEMGSNKIAVIKEVCGAEISDYYLILVRGRQNLFLTRRSTAKHKKSTKTAVNLTKRCFGCIFVPFARC